MLLTSKKKQFLIGNCFGSIECEFTFSWFRLGWAVFGRSIKTIHIHLLFLDVIVLYQFVSDKLKRHLKELMK